MSQGILLESGTNELELLVFRVGDTAYGINVAKVRELIQRSPTIAIPNAPSAIEGSFKLRESVLTLVNLARYLGVESKPDNDGLIIIIELNETRCGILVDGVEMIHRLRWDNIEPPSPFIAQLNSPITAVARIDERVVQILDFETILSELLGISMGKVEESVMKGGIDRSQAKILLADDSITVRQTIENLLKKLGFGEVVVCVDGEEAWQYLVRCKEEKSKQVDVVLSDIEMPRMDGMHLTARIRGDATLAKMPVVLFSSIISGDTSHRSRSVGANAQVTKSDTKGLVDALDACLQG